MILGRPTTRALFARISVGLGVCCIFMAGFAGPAHAWFRPFVGRAAPDVPALGVGDERSPVPAPAGVPDDIMRPGGAPAAESVEAVPAREDPPAAPSTSSGVPSQSPTASPTPPPTPTAVAVPVVSPADAPGEVQSAVLPSRPRFDLALGMGGSFDSSGLVKGRTVLAPAFWFQGGIGDGALGFEARLLSTQASGRFHQMCNGVSDTPVDRLAIDIMFALRPLATEDHNVVRSDARKNPGWIARVLRSWALNIGASGENASVAAQSTFRIGVVVGSHIDLPLTPAADPTELRLRLGVRRMLGGQGAAGAVTVSDTVADVFAGLATVF